MYDPTDFEEATGLLRLVKYQNSASYSLPHSDILGHKYCVYPRRGALLVTINIQMICRFSLIIIQAMSPFGCYLFLSFHQR